MKVGQHGLIDSDHVPKNSAAFSRFIRKMKKMDMQKEMHEERKGRPANPVKKLPRITEDQRAHDERKRIVMTHLLNLSKKKKAK